jgi:dolichyl-phosphate beta-glucosyltransferase
MFLSSNSGGEPVSQTETGYVTRPDLPTPATAQLDLEVIVPAFNEERRIAPTLYALVEELQALPLRSRVRVIDNGSSDLTADTVERVKADLGAGLIALSGCSKRGKGRAVAKGMLSSSAKYVGFCDADLATPAAAITDALRLLEEGWAVVVGSRLCAGGTYVSEQPLLRRLGSVAFRTSARNISGGIQDTQCGFKFFTRDAAQRVFAHTRIQGFAFDVEILARAHALDLAVKEMPVCWSDQPGSTFSLRRDGFASFADVWALRRALSDTSARHG